MEYRSRSDTFDPQKTKSISVRFLIISLNLIALDLLIGNDTLRLLALGGSIFSIILFSTARVNESMRRNNFTNRFKGNILDIFRINLSYLRMNKKYLLISMLGLIVPILIISQSMLLTTTFNQNEIQNFLENSDNRVLDLTYSVDNHKDYLQMNQNVNLKLKELAADQSLEISEIKHKSQTNLQIVTGPEENNTFGEGFRYIPTAYLTGTYWDNSTIDVLETFPTFNLTLPLNFNGNLLIVPDYYGNTSDFMTSNEVSILIGDSFKEPSDNSAFASFNETIDYVWRPTQEDFLYIEKNNLFEDLQFIYGGLISKEQKMWEIFDTIAEGYSNSNGRVGGNPFAIVLSDVYLKFPNVGDINLDDLISKLEKFVAQINIWFSSIYGGGIGEPIGSDQSKTGFFLMNAPIIQTLKVYKDSLGDTESVLFLISGPLAGLALIFVFFTLKLVEERRKKTVAIMKMRGTSDDQIQMILIVEIIIISSISVVIGMLLSIPWTSFSLSYSDIPNSAISKIPIPSSWYWELPIIGIIFALDVNALSYRQIISAKFEDVENFVEDSQPLWQKLHIDLVLFLTGFGFWLFYSESTTEDVIQNIGPLMLLLVIFASPMVFSRYFSSFNGLILPRLFRNKGGLLKIASRNLSKQKFSTSQLSGFLLLGIMLTSVSFIVPSTYVEWGNEKVHYDLGADIYVKGLDSSNFTIWQNLSSIEGVKSYTEVSKLKPDFFIEELHLNQFIGGGFSILGVRPENFTDAAYWKSSYDDNSLSSLISSLSDNRSLLVQEDSLKNFGLKVGNPYTYFYGFDGESVTFTIKNDFNLFPTLVAQEDVKDFGFSSFIGVAHIDMVKEIGKFSSIEVGAYVKVKTGENISAVADEIANMYSYNSSISVESIEDLTAEFNNSVETKSIVTLLRGMQILTSIMILLGVAYYLIINSNERRREIGIYRSVGMKGNQIATIMAFELLVIMLFGILIGILTGLFVSNTFFSLVTAHGGKTIPPTLLYFPIKFISQIFGSILVLGLILSIFVSYRLNGKETGNILRED